MNLNDFSRFLKNIFNPFLQKDVPSQLLAKILSDIFGSRRNTALELEWKNLRLSYPQLRLKDSGKIVLNLLLSSDDFRKTVNEVPSLLYISMIENSRSYLLNDTKILFNPSHFKMGDVYVPSKNKKYEIKTFETLNDVRVKRLIGQYCLNNFNLNDIHFLISFSCVEFGSTLQDLTLLLETGLKIPKNNITFLSDKELMRTVGDGSFVINNLYDIEYNLFMSEYLRSRQFVLKKLHPAIEDKVHRRQIASVLAGFENPNRILDKKTFRLVKSQHPKSFDLDGGGSKNSSDDSSDNSTGCDDVD